MEITKADWENELKASEIARDTHEKAFKINKVMSLLIRKHLKEIGIEIAEEKAFKEEDAKPKA